VTHRFDVVAIVKLQIQPDILPSAAWMLADAPALGVLAF
jgi:hypothetical protein